MDKALVSLSKLMSYALRHEPWVFELELDEKGWVEIEKLILALKKNQPEIAGIDKSHFKKIIEQSSKTRFEINEHQIRALYGHSIPKRLLKTPAQPPKILYHGTTIETAEIIKKDGIKPMSRQYVHLSIDTDTAKEVAKRKGAHITLLVVHAQKAYDNGIGFYLGNDKVWLSDAILPDYLEFSC
tara:strand:+ start:39187 stop:39738 length:552 start_codon:yes stop_codon:yes gene_type:complete